MADPMLIDVDDVVMVDDLPSKEPVVIDDEDDERINNDRTLSVLSVSTEGTIVLDDETPITTRIEPASKVMNKQAEKSFINNLENNRLVDKIVTRCLTMENATGMPRVVFKTLLPLYKDTCNRFKETDAFKTLLKKTYKQLMKDPDHKFLHVKRLCEELKSGGLRRKVPFVTLATNLKNADSQPNHKELTSSSTKIINQNGNKNVEIRRIPEINRRNYTTLTKRFGARARKRKVSPRSRVVTRSVTQTEKTDIIDLDDSETESADSVGSENDDGQNDVIIVEETEPSDQRNDNLNTLLQETLEAPKESNKVLQVTLGEDSNKENNVIQDSLEKDSSNENKVTQSTLETDLSEQNKFGKVYKRKYKRIQSTIETDCNTQNKVIKETIAKDSNKQNKLMQAPFVKVDNKQGKVIQPTIETASNTQNKVIKETLAKDANKQNKVLQDYFILEENDRNGKSADNELDYDLLIPKNRLQVLCKNHISVMSETEPPAKPEGGAEPVGGAKSGGGAEPGGGTEPGGSAGAGTIPCNLANNDEIARLEVRIAYLKQCIDKLEEEEVTTESSLRSAYYVCSKYKEEVVACYKKICQLTGNSEDIVKRREIRLQVTKGHPPGPAKRLEDFLNRTIDKTGAVAFPDFSDVLKCVVESKLADNLAWNNHQTVQEAVALFRQCGQALRKRRQKREYRDLLGLIRNKEETDDPAEKDPLLLAKLEENKRIAKAKEEYILDSYVAMEQNTVPQYTAEFDSEKDSSDSESESEPSITETEECSRNNVNLFDRMPNNLNGSSTVISKNHSNVGQSSNTNDVFVSNLVVTPTPTAALGKQNLLLTYLLNAPTNPHFVKDMITRERLKMNDDSSNKQIDLDVLPVNTRSSTPDYLDVLPVNTRTSTPDYLDELSVNTRSSTPDSMSECETTDISDIEEKVNLETELTITETTVCFNTATSDKERDMISISRNNIENTDLTVNNRPCNVSDMHNTVSSSTGGIEQNCDSSISPDVLVKTENHVKSEPLNIQNMLDELGDGFVCQVFDIEDPFLVIEISSDESTDDEEL